METEVWPNLVAQCARRRVPLALVNARLSQRSLARGQRFSGLIGAAARSLTCVAAQTAADAERIARLGAANVQVTGSLKFDVAPPPEAASLGAALRRQIGARPVLLCASTRDGEEALILAAMRGCDLGDALLLLVPRHPQRFEQVAQLVAAAGLPLARRSTLGDEALRPEVRVLLGDSMGEMFTYYAACRPRLHRRQPAAARRAEPDRGLRGGQAGLDRAAHLQLQRGQRRCARGRRGAAGGKCGGAAGHGAAPAACRCRARRDGPGGVWICDTTPGRDAAHLGLARTVD